MTVAAESPPVPLSPAGLVAEVFRRQPALAALGFLFALLLIPDLIAAGMDPRTLDGAEVWDKPAKFLASISLFALTSAWIFGFVEPQARRGGTARTIVTISWITAVFEMSYIALQASQGERSHFNFTDVFHSVMYALMGMGAVLLVATSLLLAWLVVRRPAAGLRAPMRDALVLGLVFTFLLGGGLGGFMSQHGSHWMTPEAARGAGLPLFGWSTTGGDLRPPHFFGIHAQQLLPFMAVAVPGRGLASRLAVWLIAAAYAGFTVWVFWRSLNGLPLVPASMLPALG